MSLTAILIALVLGGNALLVATFWALAGKPPAGLPRPRRRRAAAGVFDRRRTTSLREGGKLPEEAAARSAG